VLIFFLLLKTQFPSFSPTTTKMSATVQQQQATTAVARRERAAQETQRLAAVGGAFQFTDAQKQEFAGFAGLLESGNSARVQQFLAAGGVSSVNGTQVQNDNINTAITNGTRIAQNTRGIIAEDYRAALQNRQAITFQGIRTYQAEELAFVPQRVDLGKLTKVEDLSANARALLTQQELQEMDGTYSGLDSVSNSVYPLNSENVLLTGALAATLDTAATPLGRIQVTAGASGDARKLFRARVAPGLGVDLTFVQAIQGLATLAPSVARANLLTAAVSIRSLSLGGETVTLHPASIRRLGFFVNEDGSLKTGTLSGNLVLQLNVTGRTEDGVPIIRSHEYNVGSQNYIQLMRETIEKTNETLSGERTSRRAALANSGKVSRTGGAINPNGSGLILPADAEGRLLLQVMFRLLHVSGYADVIAPLVASGFLDLLGVGPVVSTQATAIQIKRMFADLNRISAVLVDVARHASGVQAYVKKVLGQISHGKQMVFNGVEVTEQNRKQLAQQALRIAQAALLADPFNYPDALKVQYPKEEGDDSRIGSVFVLARNEKARTKYTEDRSTQRKGVTFKVRDANGNIVTEERAVSGFSQKNSSSVLRPGYVTSITFGGIELNTNQYLSFILGYLNAYHSQLLARLSNLQKKAYLLSMFGAAGREGVDPLLIARVRDFNGTASITPDDGALIDAAFNALIGDRAALVAGGPRGSDPSNLQLLKSTGANIKTTASVSVPDAIASRPIIVAVDVEGNDNEDLGSAAGSAVSAGSARSARGRGVDAAGAGAGAQTRV